MMFEQLDRVFSSGGMDVMLEKQYSGSIHMAFTFICKSGNESTGYLKDAQLMNVSSSYSHILV